MDFVPNHTSDQHTWFKNSIEKHDKYADYYIWKDALNQADVLNDNKTIPLPPNNWVRDSGNIASYTLAKVPHINELYI